MSLHTKVLLTLSCLACYAVAAMVTIATNPDWTPTLAQQLAPYAALVLPSAFCVSYGLDIWQGHFSHD